MLLALFFAFFHPASGQENILYSMSNLSQTNYLNPAHLTGNSKVVIDLPLFSGFSFSLNNSFSFNDLASLSNKRMIIDMNKFYLRIPQNNYLSENLKLPLIDLQLQFKNKAISFGIFENQLLRGGFDRNLIRLIDEGNYPWIGSTIYTGFDLNFLHYREYSLGYTQRVNKNLTFGSRVKFLSGLSAFDVKKMVVGIETGENMEFLKVTVTGDYNICMPFSIGFNEEPNSGENTSNLVHYITNTSNPGIAVDLGASYLLFPHFELSASIIDLGFIHWKSNAEKVTYNGSFIWQGFNLSNIPNSTSYNDAPYRSPLQTLIDSLNEILNYKSKEIPFNSVIPTKIYLSGNYKVCSFLNAGLVDRILLYDKQVANAITLSGNLNLGNILSLSVGYSIIDNSYYNLSLGTALKFGPVQIYCLTDNILAFSILRAQNFNIRVGMNFMFGKIISDKE